MAFVAKDLAPCRIGKHSNLKTAQKHIKNTIFSIFGVLLPYFACGGVFLFWGGGGGQVLRKAFGENVLKCAECYDRKAKIACTTSKCCNR